MLATMYEKNDTMASLLKFMAEAPTISGDAVLMVQSEIDCIIKSIDEKQYPDTIRFLKETKRFLIRKSAAKYIALVDLLGDEYTPFLATDISGTTTEVLSVLPERTQPAWKSSSNQYGYWREGTYHPYKREPVGFRQTFYISKTAQKVGHSGAKYNCLTTIEPAQFDPAKDLVVSSYGITDHMPEGFNCGLDSLGRKQICFPFASSHAEAWWSGTMVEIDGIAMGKVLEIKSLVKV